MDKSNLYQQNKRNSNAPRGVASVGAVAAGAGAAYAVRTKLSNGDEEADDNVPSVEETPIEVIPDKSPEDSAENVQHPVGQTGGTAVYDESVPEIDVQPEPDPLPGPDIDPELEPYPEPDPLPGPDIDPEPEPYPEPDPDPDPDIDLESDLYFDVIS